MPKRVESMTAILLRPPAVRSSCVSLCVHVRAHIYIHACAFNKDIDSFRHLCCAVGCISACCPHLARLEDLGLWGFAERGPWVCGGSGPES